MAQSSPKSKIVDATKINPDLPPVAENAISVLVLTWPHFDHILTEWLILLTEMQQDIGRILIGKMETNTKLDRLKAISKHLGHDADVKTITRISKSHEHFSKIRNTIAHCPILGMNPDRPLEILFVESRFVRGRRDLVDVSSIRLERITAAAEFATKTAATIMRALSQAQPTKFPLLPR